MDIKGLLDVTCKTVANMIKGKAPEEIRRTFNIKNDFTPQEVTFVFFLFLLLENQTFSFAVFRKNKSKKKTNGAKKNDNDKIKNNSPKIESSIDFCLSLSLFFLFGCVFFFFSLSLKSYSK